MADSDSFYVRSAGGVHTVDVNPVVDDHVVASIPVAVHDGAVAVVASMPADGFTIAVDLRVTQVSIGAPGIVAVRKPESETETDGAIPIDESNTWAVVRSGRKRRPPTVGIIGSPGYPGRSPYRVRIPAPAVSRI